MFKHNIIPVVTLIIGFAQETRQNGVDNMKESLKALNQYADTCL